MTADKPEQHSRVNVEVEKKHSQPVAAFDSKYEQVRDGGAGCNVAEKLTMSGVYRRRSYGTNICSLVMRHRIDLQLARI